MKRHILFHPIDQDYYTFEPLGGCVCITRYYKDENNEYTTNGRNRWTKVPIESARERWDKYTELGFDTMTEDEISDRT